MSAGERAGREDLVRLSVVVGALGVVFGDIGTSPIYTLQTVFNPADPHPVPVSTDNVLRGRLADLLVGDDHRHGHLRAAGHARRQRRRGRHHGADHPARGSGAPAGPRAARSVLAALGIFGASLFFGDSMITPAISVLSAVEGLKVVQPSLDEPDRADHRGDHRRAVLGAAAGHRGGGPALRAGDDRVVRGHRRVRRASASPTTRRSSRRCRRPTRSASWSATSRPRSSPWPRSCSRSPARKRCTPTWVTSGAGRSPGPG